jgi:hypothetical protein
MENGTREVEENAMKSVETEELGKRQKMKEGRMNYKK